MGLMINLKELRTEKGFTQRELANKLNLSANVVCEWEKGRCEPSIDTLKKLASIFDCSIDFLVNNSDSPQSIILSETERELILDYRALTPALQKMLRATIETWKGSDANAGAKKNNKNTVAF